MEPCAPGTENDANISDSTSDKQKQPGHILNLKAKLKRSGKFENVYVVTRENILKGVKDVYCRACECRVLGSLFDHNEGPRHGKNLQPDEVEEKSEEKSKELLQSIANAAKTKDFLPTVMDIAPGEPIPPGFETDIWGVAHIQQKIDTFKVLPLVGVEYLVELQDDNPNKEFDYLCVLCDAKGRGVSFISHMFSSTHLRKYMAKHFSKCFLALAPYFKNPNLWHISVQKIAEAIERKYGRLKPLAIEKVEFEKYQNRYLDMVENGHHFTQVPGCTFEEFIVRGKSNEPPPQVYYLAKPELQFTPPEKKEIVLPKKPDDMKSKLLAAKLIPKTKDQPILAAKLTPKSEDKPILAAKHTPKSEDKPILAVKHTPKSVAKPISAPVAHSPIWNKTKPHFNASIRKPVKTNFKARKSSPLLPYERAKSPSPPKKKVRTLEIVTAEMQKDRHKKIEEFRKLSRAIETDMQKILKKQVEKPENHPRYKQEWNDFWNNRSKVLQAVGVDINKHDFKPEWIIHWNKRMVELHSDAVRDKKEALRIRLDLPQEQHLANWARGIPIEAEKTILDNPIPKPTNQPTNPIPIKLKKDDANPSNRSEIPSDKRKPVRRSRSKSRERATRRSRSRDKSPSFRSNNVLKPKDVKGRENRLKDISKNISNSKNVIDLTDVDVTDESAITNRDLNDKRSYSRGKNPHLNSKDHNVLKKRSRSRSKSRELSKWNDIPRADSPPKERKSRSRERSRSREFSKRKEFPREGSPMDRKLNTRERPRSREISKQKELSRAESPSTDRKSLSKEINVHSRPKEIDKSELKVSKYRRSRSRESREEREQNNRMEYTKSSYSRDCVAREINRPPVNMPWERENAYRKSYVDSYPPTSRLREVPRHPVNVQEEDEVEVNIMDVLRILCALEDRLGSLGPKVVDLLTQVLSMEKKEPNSSETLLDNDINCVMLETAKEKLRGHLLAGLVDIIQERAFKKAIKKISTLLSMAGQRKRQLARLLPSLRHAPVVSSSGGIDRDAVGKQIATSLFMQGKTSVTQAHLQQLVNQVVGLAETSKNADQPVKTSNFLQQIALGNIAFDMPKEKEKIIIPTAYKSQIQKLAESFIASNSFNSFEPGLKDNVITPTTYKKFDSNKSREPSPISQKDFTDSLQGYSDHDLQGMLQNFDALTIEDQKKLIAYLSKLELKDPARVNRLKRFIDIPSKSTVDIREPISGNFQTEQQYPLSKHLTKLSAVDPVRGVDLNKVGNVPKSKRFYFEPPRPKDSQQLSQEMMSRESVSFSRAGLSRGPDMGPLGFGRTSVSDLSNSVPSEPKNSENFVKEIMARNLDMGPLRIDRTSVLGSASSNTYSKPRDFGNERMSGKPQKNLSDNLDLGLLGFGGARPSSMGQISSTRPPLMGSSHSALNMDSLRPSSLQNDRPYTRNMGQSNDRFGNNFSPQQNIQYPDIRNLQQNEIDHYY